MCFQNNVELRKGSQQLPNRGLYWCENHLVIPVYRYINMQEWSTRGAPHVEDGGDDCKDGASADVALRSRHLLNAVPHGLDVGVDPRQQHAIDPHVSVQARSEVPLCTQALSVLSRFSTAGRWDDHRRGRNVDRNTCITQQYAQMST